jgi:hypothetical protein
MISKPYYNIFLVMNTGNPWVNFELPVPIPRLSTGSSRLILRIYVQQHTPRMGNDAKHDTYTKICHTPTHQYTSLIPRPNPNLTWTLTLTRPYPLRLMAERPKEDRGYLLEVPEPYASGERHLMLVCNTLVCRLFTQCVADPIWGVCWSSYTPLDFAGPGPYV